ncbi:MAG: bifunctional 3-(3-hydroxy-phenyl)propionate/3-hydroxycinnamic acid hydroxylase [Limnohabitans sp.]|nr:bifunctional 3-(3-hydroxy-phenyl)propionate/3-hydroxycinnamic acid hydroxylase [Limnohabitans sp.]
MFDVAIVGFGPTGAVAAGLLGLQGIRTWVCDELTDVYDKPRAIALDHEIMRVFQQLGLADALEPFTEPFTNSEFYGVDGQLIKCMSTVAPPYPLTFTPSLVFTQPAMEAVLRERVSRMPSVECHLGTKVTAVQQSHEAVTLTVADAQGQTRQISARYLIGCDGASSFVRKQVGIELEDLGFDEPWLVVDVRVNDKGLAKLPKVSVQYCEPQRPCTYVIGPKNHRRWEIALNPGEDPKAMATPEATWQLLSRWLKPDEATLWRQASYQFHALVAKEWRRQRVFLAGDAAHQQPPFLGQGMCQGIRDAANLSWKLAAVLQSRASPRLLDTYGAERKGHVTELTSRIKSIGQLVGQRDVEKARARDARLLAECGGQVQPMPRQNVQPALVGGCLNGAGHAAEGTLFPQAWIERPTGPMRMDEALGCGWRLFLHTPADETWTHAAAFAHAGLQLTVQHLNAPGFTESSGVLSAWFDRMACQAALVRPDHYVYGAFATPQDLQRTLEALRP